MAEYFFDHYFYFFDSQFNFFDPYIFFDPRPDDEGVFSKEHKKKTNCFSWGETTAISTHHQRHTVNEAFFPHTQRKHPSQNAATCWCFATNNAQNHSNQRPRTKDHIDDISSLPQLLLGFANPRYHPMVVTLFVTVFAGQEIVNFPAPQKLDARPQNRAKTVVFSMFMQNPKQQA